jgi:hypothetical protein
MRSKVLVSVLVAICMLFAFGIVKNAQADQLLFPWIIKSQSVSTIISVVNTAGSNLGWNYLGVDQQLHYQYWYKIATDTGTAASQTIPCTNQSFKRPTSKDDLVMFDASANIRDGKALFGDSTRYADQSFKLSAAGPVRAFLLVDNDTPFFTNGGNNIDGTLYGEALVLELAGGAAWGYIAYNASGNSGASMQTSPVYMYDGLDALGEVLGGNGPAVEAIGQIGQGEVTPVVLPAAQALTMRAMMTPIDNSGAPATYTNDNNSLDQRIGNANAKIQLIYNPAPNEFYGGLFTDDESPIDFTKKKNIVCTSADTLQDLMTEAAWTDFSATQAPGWSMIDIQTGDLDVNENDRIDNPTDDMIVGKLEYSISNFSFDGTSPAFPQAAINNMNWIRNSSNYPGVGCVGINCVRNHVISLLPL